MVYFFFFILLLFILVFGSFILILIPQTWSPMGYQENELIALGSNDEKKREDDEVKSVT